MGRRRVVLDGADSQSIGLQGGDGRLSPAAGAFHVNLYLPHAHSSGLDRHLLRGTGGGKRRGLAGTLEPDGPG